MIRTGRLYVMFLASQSVFSQSYLLCNNILICLGTLLAIM